MANLEKFPSPATCDGERRTVMVADRNPLIRLGLKALVSTVVGCSRILEAVDADTLPEVAAENPPIGLALIDLQLSGTDCGPELPAFCERYPETPVVVMSTTGSINLAKWCLDLGSVFAFVSKSASLNEFGLAIEAAMVGRKLSIDESESSAGGKGIALTRRQEEIRRLLTLGLSNKVIADTLNISESTVKNHLTNIFKALNTTNRTQTALTCPASANKRPL
jgi:DNA-binding NarL/FixJ family response regulator